MMRGRQILDWVFVRRQHAADLIDPVGPRITSPEVIDPQEAALLQVGAKRLGTADQPNPLQMAGHGIHRFALLDRERLLGSAGIQGAGEEITVPEQLCGILDPLRQGEPASRWTVSPRSSGRYEKKYGGKTGYGEE